MSRKRRWARRLATLLGLLLVPALTPVNLVTDASAAEPRVTLGPPPCPGSCNSPDTCAIVLVISVVRQVFGVPTC